MAGRVPNPLAVAVLGTLALAAGALGFGALYALSAYELDPSVLPIALAAAAAIAVGLWRLDYGIALLVVVAPFSENAPISDPAGAKLRMALVLWAIVLVAVQGTRLLLSDAEIRRPPLLAGALAFAGAALLSVPVAAEVGAAASKFMLLCGTVAIYLLGALLLRSWDELKVVLAGFLVAGLAVSVHALYQYVTGDLSRVGFISESGAVEFRVASFFPHPNQLAGFLVVIVPIALALMRIFDSTLARSAALVTMVLASSAALITVSRGAVLALVALALLQLGRRAAWPALAVALVVSVLFAPDALNDRVADVAKTDRPEIAIRLDFWEASIQMFESSPLVGVGLNNFGEAYVGLERAGRTFLGPSGLIAPETAHNLYLNTLAEQGLLGVVALMALAAGVVRLTIALLRASDGRTRALGHGLMGVGVVLAVHNLFDVTFVDPKTATAVWAFFGVAAAAAGLDRETEPAEPA
jgi:putative inorganic carbon (hco3(-)) transporter